MSCENLVLLNIELAELMGWTNIRRIGIALIGNPPAESGIVSVRNEARIPEWSLDNNHIVTLQAQHHLTVGVGALGSFVNSVECKKIAPVTMNHANFSTKEECMRAAVVQFVINKIKSFKSSGIE